jgi:hypothetical protein
MKAEPIPKAGGLPGTNLPGDLPRMFSYTARASKVLNGSSFAVRRFPSAQSRMDFLRAVSLLAAVPARRGWRSRPPKREIHDVWTTFLRYPLETWAKVFGEPESEMHLHWHSRRQPFRVWQYHCSDGVVRCIAYVLDRPQRQWLLVARVCCY